MNKQFFTVLMNMSTIENFVVTNDKKIRLIFNEDASLIDIKKEMAQKAIINEDLILFYIRHGRIVADMEFK